MQKTNSVLSNIQYGCSNAYISLKGTDHFNNMGTNNIFIFA